MIFVFCHRINGKINSKDFFSSNGTSGTRGSWWLCPINLISWNSQKYILKEKFKVQNANTINVYCRCIIFKLFTIVNGIQLQINLLFK